METKYYYSMPVGYERRIFATQDEKVWQLITLTLERHDIPGRDFPMLIEKKVSPYWQRVDPGVEMERVLDFPHREVSRLNITVEYGVGEPDDENKIL